MKYRYLVTTALLSVALAAPAAGDTITDAYRFRGLDWGCGMTDIIASETNADMSDDDYEIGATYYALNNVKIADLSAVAVFYLDSDSLGLERGAYALTEPHADVDQYISDYDKLLATYKKKYGKPLSSGNSWKKGSAFQDTPGMEGVALASGELAYFADWEAEDGSRIEISMTGEDYEVSTTVFYYSPDYTEQEDDYNVFADDSI